jgi:hypothetical protein
MRTGDGVGGDDAAHCLGVLGRDESASGYAEEAQGLVTSDGAELRRARVVC